jgi:hypothetical protein
MPMAERKIEAVRAWAVLGRTRQDEPLSLDKATIYPSWTDRGWLERSFPGRVVPVETRPLPEDAE